MHQPTHLSSQSINPTISDRSNIDSSSTTTNGAINYPNSSINEHGSSSSLRPFNSALTGSSNPTATTQSHYSHNHPPSSSHVNTLQSSAGHFSQMSNGNDNNSHSSFHNNSNHIAGMKPTNLSLSIRFSFSS